MQSYGVLWVKVVKITLSSNENSSAMKKHIEIPKKNYKHYVPLRRQ